MTLVDPSLYDPWEASDTTQGHHVRADIQVMVNGMDVTDKVNPHLIMARILTGAHIEDYTCELELDDRDGTLPIPEIDSDLSISIGWRGEPNLVLWEGVIHDIEHGFGRKQGGRRMWIHGMGGTFLGKAKEPMYNSWGTGAPDGKEQGPNVAVSTVLKEAAGHADQNIEIHKDFDNVEMQRDWWQQMGESYYHFAKRLAEEMGAVFRVKARNQGQFTQKGENIDGTPTPDVIAVWAHNLIGWRVRPLATRTQWAGSKQHSFHHSQGKWEETKTAGGAQAPFNMSKAISQLAESAPNKAQAGGDNQGANDGIEQQQGPGRIVINGEPDAQGNCHVQLIGARPGVDGLYWCPTIEHIYSRQGYVTWCDVQAVQITGQTATGGPYSQHGGTPPPMESTPLDAPPETPNPLGGATFTPPQ
jgi:uncharacterized protein